MLVLSLRFEIDVILLAFNELLINFCDLALLHLNLCELRLLLGLLVLFSVPDLVKLSANLDLVSAQISSLLLKLALVLNVSGPFLLCLLFLLLAICNEPFLALLVKGQRSHIGHYSLHALLGFVEIVSILRKLPKTILKVTCGLVDRVFSEGDLVLSSSDNTL